ncbi:hypothetical protein CONPUDRAFT_59133, partial [Coniophora puteana RWD-64-598 SS2]
LRYAKPEFLNSIANDTPLPMIVDAEMGMPLDLSQWECLWDEDGDDSLLNPDTNNLPLLDPADQALLGDPVSMPTPYTNGSPSAVVSGVTTPTPANVTWLRKTEYLSRESSQRGSTSQEPKMLQQHIDVSRAAQLRDIEASFSTCNDPSSFDLATLQHPNKPGVTAVESYEIFPDADIWANAYDLFRFNERPGERPLDAEDPRLDCAILRPMESDGDHFLAYYLTKDDESAITFKESRSISQHADADQPSASFHYVRDYETVKVEQEVPNEFLLVLDDGDTTPYPTSSSPSVPRAKAAYYKNIERKMTLKKRRVAGNESYGDKWQVVHVSHTPFAQEELDERAEVLAEVVDPMFLLNRTEADAEGEVDESAVAQADKTDDVMDTADTDPLDIF